MANKNMNKILSISALASGILALASCNNNEPTTPKEEPADPNLINFSLSQDVPSSRTQYDKDNWNKIEWVLGDRVTIWCEQAGSGSPATYQVTKLGESKNKATISAIGGGLTWGDKEALHTFCAIYGESACIKPKTDETGTEAETQPKSKAEAATTATAKLKYSTTQTLTKCDNGSWANMQQAYMVAFNQTKPVESVGLRFHPVMTTLDVVVKGMSVDDAESITIQSMSITTHQNVDVLYEEGGETYFDVEFGSDGPTTSTLTQSSERTYTFTLKEPQTVAAGGSLLITANLPRIAIGGEGGQPVTITINAKDGSNKFTFINEVIAGNKVKITTKPWEKPAKYVDLGLPSGTKWATCNLGANEDYEIGNYYGWGCISYYGTGVNVDWTPYFNQLGLTGTSYTSSTCGGSDDPLKEYVINNISISGTEFDAANAQSGAKWRMPNTDEIRELINSCKWKWEDNYKGLGVKGYVVSNKGNSIFLPATGCRKGTEPSDVGCGYYWSSTPVNKSNANYLSLDPDYYQPIVIDSSSRKYGYAIRPVLVKTNTAGIDRQGSSGSSTAEDWQ